MAAIMTLAPASDGFYGAGYTYTRNQGNLEGAFKADWNGNLIFVQDCHGDEYSLAVTADAVYVAGHPHYCGNVGSFNQTQPWTFNRALAFTTDVRGKLGTEPWGYYNFAGQPAPAQLNWYPDIEAGTYTGQAQGPWSVAANDDYVLYGGEFPIINGTAQQGLVRFAKRTIAPNTDGPRLGGDFADVTVRAYGNNALRVAWPANYDRDNERLTYRVYRDNVLVYETTADSRFYQRPNLSYLDTTVAPGQTYTYRVRASDPFGNTMWSSYVPGASGSGTALSSYQKAVLADGAKAYWSLNETSGSSMADLAGTDSGNRNSQVTQGVPGAISGESGTAFRLTGSANTSTMNSTTAQRSTDWFSTELWLKTTTTRGGQLIGFDSSTSGGGSYADRHVYMTNSGQIAFTVKPGGAYKSVNSTATYRDGNWHHVVATLSGAGMALYVDGVQVGFDELTKTGLQFNTRVGYWKMGGDTLTNYPNRPTSNYFAGDVDEIATYPVALTAAQVQAHYNLGSTGVAPNVLPNAAFSSAVTNLKASFDASGSSDSDGTIASYAWDFGDGLTGTGATTTHTYASAGTYRVSLVVTDDRSGTATTSRDVTVTEPPNVAPVAAFTSSSNDLTVSVDGSTSTDSDGTIATYAWDFGDGTAGSGVTASHSYAAAGTYVVRLTVTDDDGATHTTTATVTVPTGGAVAYALDDFNRSATNGWGSAEVGGAYTYSGGNTGFAVTDGDGIVGVTPGVRRTVYLNGASSASTDLRLGFTTDVAATGGGQFVTVYGRRVSATDDYRIELKLTNASRVTASIAALKGGTASSLTGAAVTLPGTYTPGTDVNVRFRITGSSPTTLEAKVWLGSDPEPSEWTLTTTDSHPALQAAGSVALSDYLSGSAAPGTVRLLLHRLTATP